MKHIFKSKVGNVWKVRCPKTNGYFYTSVWNKLPKNKCPCCGEIIKK